VHVSGQACSRFLADMTIHGGDPGSHFINSSEQEGLFGALIRRTRLDDGSFAMWPQVSRISRATRLRDVGANQGLRSFDGGVRLKQNIFMWTFHEENLAFVVQIVVVVMYN
jgi:hypothetical protein